MKFGLMARGGGHGSEARIQAQSSASVAEGLASRHSSRRSRSFPAAAPESKTPMPPPEEPASMLTLWPAELVLTTVRIPEPVQIDAKVLSKREPKTCSREV